LISHEDIFLLLNISLGSDHYVGREVVPIRRPVCGVLTMVNNFTPPGLSQGPVGISEVSQAG
jgi:hypothetical protein